MTQEQEINLIKPYALSLNKLWDYIYLFKKIGTICYYGAKYSAIPERHKTGMPHLFMISNGTPRILNDEETLEVVIS